MNPRRALCTLVLCLLASGATAQVTTPHPRLILDAATLGALRARAASNTPQWRALKAYCDSFIGGTVNYPDHLAYPDPPDIGQGYQGEDYFPALIGEAFCYQTLRVSDPTTAAKYGAKAVDVLVKMSMPFPGAHGEHPSTDSGFAVRFFGVGMGIAYDWLYGLLTPEQRKQVYSTANGWTDYWEGSSGPSTCGGLAPA